MGVVVSVTDLTTAAGWMAGLAIAALVFAGWRNNARAIPRTPRAQPKLRRPRVPIGIAEATVPLYKAPNPLRRIWAAVASAGLGIVIGVVSAILIAFGASYAVITLTDLLKS
jgi:ABC-type nitrate/sulfonate/bicarbonate transport system permease component